MSSLRLPLHLSLGLLLGSSACAGGQPPPAAQPTPSASAAPRPLPPGVGPQRGGKGNKAGLAALESAKKKARDGDLAGAAADVETAIGAAPGEAEPYLLLASLHDMREDRAAAKGTLERGLAAVPRSMALHHALGMNLLEGGDAKAAVTELEQAKALLGVEKNVEVFADLAYAYLFAERVGDAEKLAAEARQLDARAFAPAFTHGEALFRLGRFKDAAAAYAVAAELAPDDPLPEVRRASALMKATDFAGAVPVLERVVAKKTDDPRLFAMLAQALIEAGRAKDAVKPAEQALSMAPDQAAFRELLATAQEAAGDKAGAKKTRAGGKKR